MSSTTTELTVDDQSELTAEEQREIAASADRIDLIIAVFAFGVILGTFIA